MGENTSIEWADHTINFAWGCTKVSKECQKCYAERLSIIFKKRFNPPWETVLKNQISKLKSFKPGSIIFFNSMTDTFHESFSFELIESWFKILEGCQEYQFIILTKRINRAYNFFKVRSCPDNCWIGTSIGTKSALHRLPKLKLIHAKIRFLSLEPLLEDLGDVDLSGIQWVIVGGESDFKEPRPFDIAWARNIRDQCKKYKVPFFFKQTGGTKKINGCWGSNLIDGKTYLEMPILLQTKPSTARVERKGLENWT